MNAAIAETEVSIPTPMWYSTMQYGRVSGYLPLAPASCPGSRASIAPVAESYASVNIKISTFVAVYAFKQHGAAFWVVLSTTPHFQVPVREED